MPPSRALARVFPIIFENVYVPEDIQLHFITSFPSLHSLAVLRGFQFLENNTEKSGKGFVLLNKWKRSLLSI